MCGERLVRLCELCISLRREYGDKDRECSRYIAGDRRRREWIGERDRENLRGEPIGDLSRPERANLGENEGERLPEYAGDLDLEYERLRLEEYRYLSASLSGDGDRRRFLSLVLSTDSDLSLCLRCFFFFSEDLCLCFFDFFFFSFSLPLTATVVSDTCCIGTATASPDESYEFMISTDCVA